MLKARGYLDKVRLFVKGQSRDEYRALVTTFTDKGLFPCDISQFTGYRLMQYQQMGINYPILIEMREVGFIPDKIEWEGQEVSIKSIVPDLRKRTLRVEGFLKEQPTYPDYVTTTINEA